MEPAVRALSQNQEVFHRFLGDSGVVIGQFPIDVKVSLAIDGQNPFGPLRAAQADAAVFEVNLGIRQIEFEFLRGKHDPHVPDAFLDEGLVFPGPAAWYFVTNHGAEIEIV